RVARTLAMKICPLVVLSNVNRRACTAFRCSPEKEFSGILAVWSRGRYQVAPLGVTIPTGPSSLTYRLTGTFPDRLPSSFTNCTEKFVADDGLRLFTRRSTRNATLS